MSGYGRGGRGAALLKALESPVRRPGETNPNAPPTASSAPPGVAASTQQLAPVLKGVPMGRGALLQQRLLAQQQAAASPQPSPVASPPMQTPAVPAGRGAMLGRAVMGRGAALMQQMGVKPKSPPGVPPTEPTRHSPLVPESQQHPPRPASRSPVQPPTPCLQRPPSQASPVQQQHPGDGLDEASRLERMFKEMNVGDGKDVGKGSSGNRIPLAANYIPVRCKNQGLYQYAVSFDPQIDSRGERKKLMYSHKDSLGEAFEFDGAALALLVKLPNKETILQSVRQREQTTVNIKIKFVKVVPQESCIKFYTLKLRSCMYMLKMCQVGRNYYLPDKSVHVPQHKLEIWPGFVTSLHHYEGGLMLLCDVHHRVLRTQTVLNVMNDIHQSCQQRGNQDFYGEAKKQLLGVTVLTRYNNKTYRIDDIAWNMTPQNTFSTARDGQVSFIDYYMKAYNKRIKDSDQPLLVHRPSAKDKIRSGRRGDGQDLICLVPELCYMTGLTDEMRSDFRVMKDLASHTRVQPNQRAAAMANFVNALTSHPEASKELEKWGLSLDLNQVMFDGRLLKPEMVYFRQQRGQDRSVSAGPEADWGRSLDREHVITPVDLKRWLVIFTPKDKPLVLKWIDKNQFVARNMGIQVAPPVPVPLINDRSETYLRAIKEHLTPEVQVVVCIFPTSRDDRYNAVKKLCCVEMPVPSQVIIAKTIREERKLKSVAVKIALQINVKLGGELWGVDIPMNGLMVCGIDVYHEGRGGSGKSVGAFVSSLNSRCTRWYSRCCFQSKGQELMDSLLPAFVDAIKQYHKYNHEIPKAIVIFRDGVGDGAMQYVSGHEIRQLQGAFSKWGENYQPKFAFVVVQKRINTRLFAVKGGSNLDNPGPGTVVDHTVVKRNYPDYFVVSQHVRQGTVSPTHYVLLEDSGQWKMDHVQKLSYKLTHLYYNWPGTVRVPAPCQYAHKLAYQVGQNLRKEPNGQLCDRLFYL